ncbi:MAG: ATP-binding protein, partial [Clostridia bacterium]|nr:ATP-binding protein [Clostridia bacterium]
SEMEWTVQREGEDIVLCFIDNGSAFNPLVQAEPDVHLPVEERSIGGLGIMMIRRMTDRQTYSYENGRNILTLTKRVA